MDDPKEQLNVVVPDEDIRISMLNEQLLKSQENPTPDPVLEARIKHRIKLIQAAVALQ